MIDWLENSTSNIYLVRLQVVQMKDDLEWDHVIVIDGGEKAIWDSVERYGLNLPPGNLRYCVGE